MTHSNNRFDTKYSTPTYKCRFCGKHTRETGFEESAVELCAKCYTECEFENFINDHVRSEYHDTHPVDFNTFTSAAEVVRAHAAYEKAYKEWLDEAARAEQADEASRFSISLSREEWIMIRRALEAQRRSIEVFESTKFTKKLDESCRSAIAAISWKLL